MGNNGFELRLDLNTPPYYYHIATKKKSSSSSDKKKTDKVRWHIMHCLMVSHNKLVNVSNTEEAEVHEDHRGR